MLGKDNEMLICHWTLLGIPQEPQEHMHGRGSMDASTGPAGGIPRELLPSSMEGHGRFGGIPRPHV